MPKVQGRVIHVQKERSMKIKGLKTTLALMVSVLALSCLNMFFAPKMSVVGAVDEQPQVISDAFYLDSYNAGVDFATADIDSGILKAENSLGVTNGYQDFPIGTTDVKLTTRANRGVFVVGWMIEYDGGLIKVYNQDNFRETTQNISGEDIIFTSTYEMVDGYALSSELTISKTFKNVKIEPVYDFIYYNVALNSNVVSNALPKNSVTLEAEGGIVVYYQTKTLSSSKTTYYNSVILDEGVYKYFGTIETDNSTGEELFVKQVERGAYKYNDIADIYLKVLDEKMFTLTSFKINGVSLEKDISENVENNKYFDVKNETTGLTTDVYAKFVVTSDDTEISFQLEGVYKVDVDYYVDGIKILGDEKTVCDESLNLLTTIQNVVEFNNAFNIIVDKTCYYIKNSYYNNGLYFEINTSNYLYSNSRDYLIYEYDHMLLGDSNRYESQVQLNLSDNTTAKIYYTTAKQNVNFKFVNIENGEYKVIEDMNVRDSEQRKVGESVTVANAATYASENTGYVFLGLTNSLGTAPVTSDFTYSISSNAPNDIYVYVCYEKQTYTITIDNSNLKTLTKDTNNTPIESLNVLVDGVLSQTLKPTETITATFKIGQTILFTATFNDGFVTNLFVLGKETEPGVYHNKFVFDSSTHTTTNTLTISKETIEEYVNASNALEVKYNAEFETFETTYILHNSSINTDTGELFANINYSIHARNNNVVVKGYDKDDQETTDTTKIVKYIFSNVYYSDEITLISQTTNAVNYEFVKFTDNTLRLPATADGGEYSYKETVVRNRTIYVVYNKISVKLFVGSNIADAMTILGNVSLKSASTEAELSEKGFIIYDDDVNGYGESENLVLNDYVAISVDSSKIKFGYILTGYVLISNNGGRVSYNDVNAVFRILNTEAHTIELQFAYVKFVVRIHSENFDIADQEDTLTLRDLTMSFEQPLGYYIIKGYFYNSPDKEIEVIAQTNEQVLTSAYTRTWTVVELQSIIDTLSLDQVGDSYVLDLYVQYEIHTYNITFRYASSAPYINNNLDSLILPVLSAKTNNDEVLVPEYLAGDPNKAVFANLPYGKKVEMLLSGDAQIGISLDGWATTAEDGETSDTRSFVIMAVSRNRDVTFGLSLVEYTAYVQALNIDDISKNDLAGKPTFASNESNQIKVYLGDVIKIKTNGQKLNGYKYVGAYEKYVYNESTWTNDYIDLLVFDADTKSFVPAEAEYIDGETYYILREGLTTYDGVMFDPAIMNVKDKETLFIMSYDLMKMTINHITNACEEMAVGNLAYSIDFSPSEYASYEAFVGGNLLSSTDTVSVNTTEITLRVQINNRALNSVDEKRYNLINGLNLFGSLDVNGLACTISALGGGLYEIKFVVRDVLPYLNEDAQTINIYYTYKVQTKNITITSNISDNNFYRNYMDSMYATSQNIYNETGFYTAVPMQSKLILEHNFMTAAETSYHLTTNGVKYFKVTGVKLYDVNGDEINIDDYELYGFIRKNQVQKITQDPITGEDVYVDTIDLASVYFRFVENITIEFQVQPIIYFDGEIRVADYSFINTFKHDNYGYGVAQTLTIGAGSEGSSYNISGANEIINGIVVENGEIVGNVISLSDYKNVGTYDINISFNFTSGAYTCLNGLKLNFKLKLIVEQKEVEVVVKNAGQVTQVYDGGTDYNRFDADIRNKMVITDGEGGNLELVYGANGVDFELRNDSITNVMLNAEGKASKQVSSVDGEYYDLEIRGLYLTNTDFNNNFKLKSTTSLIKEFIKVTQREVTISGLEFYDKVYDGSANAIIKDYSKITLNNIIDGDVVGLIQDDTISTLVAATYDNADIYENKTITVDVSRAVVGQDSSNYRFKTANITGGKIYPYEIVPSNLENTGIKFVNIRAKTEEDWYNYVGLIPIGATLEVQIIENGAEGFADLYRQLNNYISRSNVFSRAYKFTMKFNGNEINIDNNLFLVVPSAEKLTDVIFIAGEQNNKIDYTKQDDGLLIDLRDMGNVKGLDYLVLLHEESFLAVWQIVLIVIGVVGIIVGIVLTIVIIRKKKLKSYEINDKI